MCRTHSNLYTPQQVQNLLVTWQCTQPLPKKGTKLIVAWPGKPVMEADLAEIEATLLKGTYGDKLFKVTFSSKAGRAFDAQVQDSHVHAYVTYQDEQRRAHLRQRVG